jgi:hypothetical protein
MDSEPDHLGDARKWDDGLGWGDIRAKEEQRRERKRNKADMAEDLAAAGGEEQEEIDFEAGA